MDVIACYSQPTRYLDVLRRWSAVAEFGLRAEHGVLRQLVGESESSRRCGVLGDEGTSLWSSPRITPG